jgi:hypothetical protein
LDREIFLWCKKNLRKDHLFTGFADTSEVLMADHREGLFSMRAGYKPTMFMNGKNQQRVIFNF